MVLAAGSDVGRQWRGAVILGGPGHLSLVD